MEHRYKNGEVVEERVRPGQKLMVSRFFNHLYYCRAMEGKNRKELVYYENDLIAIPQNAAKD